MAKLREGGLAALRELRDADNEESQARANTKEDLKVLSTFRVYALLFDAAASVKEGMEAARLAPLHARKSQSSSQQNCRSWSGTGA